jgi:endonuclease YncB( thermonuclease family)
MLEMKCCAASVLLFALLFFPASGAEISGPPRIVDGDTIEIGQTKIRLVGIDAPEMDRCGNAQRRGLINTADRSQIASLKART